MAPPVKQPVLPPVSGYTPPTKATGERGTFVQFIRAHPSLKGYAGTIWSAANTYGGITPTQLAAVLLVESGGDKGAKSSKGALGIAQIHDNVANATNDAGVPFFRPNHTITTQDKQDTAFSIKYAAWRLSGYASTHGGSIDDIWKGGYNPGYAPGNAGYIGPNPISAVLPKGYVGTAGNTIDTTAGKSAATTAVEQGIKNPWVIGVSKDGKLKVAYASVAPKNAVSYDGTPMDVSSFLSLKRQLESYFVSYTGGRPDNKTVLTYVNKGWGPYSLTIALSKTPGFSKSPIWKSEAPAYQEAAKDLLPQGASVPADLIRSAILNQWTQGDFQAFLRSGQGYVQSTEFKNNSDTLLNVHQSIMGVPDASGMQAIQQAALAGWKPDQYAAWLRSQPEYTQSPEYQSKTLNFLSALGLITGHQTILTQGQSKDKPPVIDTGALPNDKRLPPGKITAPEDTVPTFSG